MFQINFSYLFLWIARSVSKQIFIRYTILQHNNKYKLNMNDVTPFDVDRISYEWYRWYTPPSVRQNTCVSYLFKEHKHLSIEMIWLLFCFRRIVRISEILGKKHFWMKFIKITPKINRAHGAYCFLYAAFKTSIKSNQRLIFGCNYLFDEIICHTCSHISKTNKTNI